MKKIIYLLMLFIIMACNTDSMEANYTATNTEVLEKGKPKKNIVLVPTVTNNNVFGRIAERPVAYDGVLPNNYNEGLVDWDNDGNMDRVVINPLGYTNTATISVFLNLTEEHIINYTSTFLGQIIGFIDVNQDGYLDIITSGGVPFPYQTSLGFIEPFGVAYNVEDRYPLSTEEIISSLVADIPNGNPDNIVWDLSEFGYKYFTFKVDFREPTTGYYGGHTHTYGEFGYFFGRINRNLTYILRFTDLDIEIEITR